MFTNQTTNYGLPQWIGTDKPAFLTDMNDAYATIDTQIKTANNNADASVATANTSNGKADTAIANAETANETALSATTIANSATTIANNANTQAGTALSQANMAVADAISAQDVVNGIINGNKKYHAQQSSVILATGITKNPKTDYIRGLDMYYNMVLKTLNLTSDISVSGTSTLTTYKAMSSMGLNFFPAIKLPIVASNEDAFIYSNFTIAGGEVGAKSANTCITTYENNLWLGYLSSGTSFSFTWTSIGLANTHFNLNAFGDISLTDWTDL